MQGKNSLLDGGQELSKITQRDFDNGSLLQRIISAINTMGVNAGVLPVGKVIPPNPIDSVTVKGTMNTDNTLVTAPGEQLHWTITHNQSVNKHVNYFSEIDTSSSFTQPHVIHHGASRSGFTTLPTNNDSGIQQTYYLRSYAQYPGGDPVKPTVYGGLTGPIKIQMGGSTNMTLLPSTGSGTAAANGTQGGKGFGVDLQRAAPGPKRNFVT